MVAVGRLQAEPQSRLVAPRLVETPAVERSPAEPLEARLLVARRIHVAG